MKTPKTNKPPQPKQVSKPAKAPDPYGLPNVEQLARLAASLGGALTWEPSDRKSRAKLKLRVYAALELWKAAEAVHFEWRGYYRTPVEMAAVHAAMPSYPMALDEFLRRVLPKSRPEDKKRAWKLYNLSQQGKNLDTATTAETEAASKKWKSPKSHAEFVLAQSAFLEWWKEFHAAEVSEGRREGGRRRAEKAAKAKKAAAEKKLKKRL
jgi:hypothetical protein